jgi:hypothetical protein
MTSRRDLIKAGALAGIAGAVPSSVTFANPVREQDKLAAGSFWPDGVRMVVSVSMQMEGGAAVGRQSPSEIGRVPYRRVPVILDLVSQPIHASVFAGFFNIPEARIAATLTNLAKQGQHLQTLVEAQVAITDVLLKYVITCVVEPPDDALPAARVRARLRYDKLIRAAAKELSNKNRDTLREMVADD